MAPMALPGGSIACHSRLGIALAAYWRNIGSALASNRSGQFAGPIVLVLGCNNLFVEESDGMSRGRSRRRSEASHHTQQGCSRHRQAPTGERIRINAGGSSRLL